MKIREIVKLKEAKFEKQKEDKNRENVAKQAESEKDSRKDETDFRPRRNSYTLSSPTFASNLLPKISVDSSESDKNTVVVGAMSHASQSAESDIYDSANDKSSKDLQNSIDKRAITPASSVYQEVIEPQVNNQLKELIERQKREYLVAMETLKNKFTKEQHQLLMDFQSNLLTTSTPLNTSMVPSIVDGASDEDFTEFKTCLQSRSLSLEEKTIVNDHDAKVRKFYLENMSLT